MIATAESIQLLTPEEVSTLLAVTRETLANWRCARTGPEYVKIGFTVRYRRDVIERWIDDNTVKTGDR